MHHKYLATGLHENKYLISNLIQQIKYLGEINTFLSRCVLKVQSPFLSFRMKNMTPLKDIHKRWVEENTNLQRVLSFLNIGSLRFWKQVPEYM